MPSKGRGWAMSDVEEIRIEPLDSGYIVSVLTDAGDYMLSHRTAEATLTGALTIAARALGYHGTIEFGSRTVAVPVVGTIPPTVGIPFDDEEPPLRAGTARPDDLL